MTIRSHYIRRWSKDINFFNAPKINIRKKPQQSQQGSVIYDVISAQHYLASMAHSQTIQTV